MASVEKLPSGKWRATAYLGRDISGKKIRKTFTADTKWQALKLAEEYKETRVERPKGMTVGDAIDGYIAAKTNVLSPTTIDVYKRVRRNWLKSIINLPLNKITHIKVQQAINEDAKHLSPKSVRNAHGLLCSALKMYAPDLTLNTTLPAKQKTIKKLPQAETVIKSVVGTDVEIPCMLAMWMSLRISEILGLKYEDISDGVLTVRRSLVTAERKNILKSSTKTFDSTRSINLPGYIMQLIAKEKEKSASDFIVTYAGGTVYRKFKEIAKENGFGNMTFHDLRHLNASVMLALGVPDKYAMERGGWSTNSTLKAVYQHTFSDERKKVDELIDSYFNSILDNLDKNDK